MGCGCGGSNRAAQQRREAARRDGGSQRQAATKPRTMGGFTWDGPERPEPKPKTA